MGARRAISQLVREQSGAVVVFVALMLPVLVGVGGLVVDVGNWFAHKRHLQVQADAGALAGAGKFRFPCVNQPIKDEVGKYSSVGVPAGAPSFNPQNTTPNGALHRKLNSKTFFNQASPVDATVPAGMEDKPCEAKMIDVKLTETDLPWLLRATGIVPFINAQARVEIRRQTIAKNLIPLGVPSPSPKKARAFFVDESKTPGQAGYVVTSTDLVRDGAQGALALWTNTASPLPVNINPARIGVRVALGDSDTPLVGSYATVCALALVNCWDFGAANGLANIRGWSATASLTAATARGVDLFGSSVLGSICADGYFNALAANCTIGVRATVDFGPNTYGPGKPKPAGVKVQALRSGSNTKYDLTYDTVTGTWSTSSVPLTTTDDGPVGIDLFWSTGCNAQGNNCTKTGTIADVQHSFEGSDSLSGPVQLVKVYENGTAGANSFQTGTTHNLVVSIGLSGNLAVAQTVTDPKVTLKFETGGLTGFLDCDPLINKVENEIYQGCAPPYTINTGHLCPYASTPLQCVPVDTGNKVGHVGPGLNHRILGAESTNVCSSPNHWSQFATGLPQGDPRIIQVFITPQDAFAANHGNVTVPIVDFAAFYVTGWQGSGNTDNPCQKAGVNPPDDPAAKGEIVGHFIKYIDLANPEGAADDPCDFTSLSPCVAAFTR